MTRTSLTTGPDTDWRHRAACLGTDPELFFPVSGSGRLLAAKAVCARCPVTVACGEWALALRIADGVWGGLDEDERKTILKAAG